MNITRHFTTPATDVFSTVEWTTRSSRIANMDGSVVFEMKDAEVPKSWSQLATDIMVSKYFRKAGVPQEDGTLGPERSARQVIHRLAGCWRHWGETHGYFDSAESAQAFYDELCHMMLHQMAAPNSPQWFNTGLHWAYGLTGPAQGQYRVDPSDPASGGEARPTEDAYTHPAPHACHILSVDDDLVNPGGIMDLWVREARIFKYGAGAGVNVSSIRGGGEKLSGGGTSSGLMSFLKVGDRAAGSIKSGGTTRRAALMRVLDLDHPDIETFVNWKVREELKVAALVEGMKHLDADQRETALRLGLELTYDFNGEAYSTVSGQNSNNSVRIPHSFFEALDNDGSWDLVRRTDGKLARTVPARDLWEQIGYAAWRCADPGLQYDTNINDWHTCPNAGKIRASNPCVTGDTLVSTTTGYRRIADLVGGTAEVIGGDGGAAFVDRIFKTGTKPVFELRTRSGFTLRLTADHRVRTANRGDVPAAELTIDDEVMLEGVGFGDAFVPEAMGELLGAAMGDGCITHSGRQDVLYVTVSHGERAVAQRLRGHVEHLKGWVNEGDARGTRPTTIVETATSLRVGTSVQRLVDRLVEYAVLDTGSAGKRFRDAVFSLDRNSQAAILRGLFTTDGTVANYGSKSQYVALDSTSREMLRQVQALLLGFGIKAKLYENRRALGQTTARLPDGRGEHADYDVQQMHSLRISRASRVIFEREIGFMPGSDKRERLASLNRGVVAYAERMTDRVVSLTPAGVEDVYDLTEPRTSHFVANGIVVHNCSEYLFVDNTSCNLASLNLLKFYNSESREFDVEAYEHAIRLWTVVLEISVLMAALPSKVTAERTYRYRTLGLGYANLGAMLMQAGIPYDSERGRAICGTLTAILTGRSYAASAEMAAAMGPFDGFAEDRENMLRVMRNHRRAAYGVERTGGREGGRTDGDGHALGEYEAVSVKPVPIDAAAAIGPVDSAKPQTVGVVANADRLLERARVCWDDAVTLGERHGYRNAQATVIAPTGTIGLLMDCDTTGVEPDFALVKFKKLAGGGYFKIANASLRPALEALGYEASQVREILEYVLGRLTLDVEMGEGGNADGLESVGFAGWLREKGLEDEDLAKVTKALPTVFELQHAFNAWTLGEQALERLGLTDDAKKPGFNLLRALGLSKRQIGELNRIICGTQTVEGAPHLRSEHLAVFDCANTCGPTGERFIAAEGHIRMMAAAQPFISGAISKTINLPNSASVDDIKGAYRLSWALGLKANALYRDGCKLSQPLNTKAEGSEDADDDAVLAAEEDEGNVEAGREAVASDLVEAFSGVGAKPQAASERVVERIVERPLRRRLPDTRRSVTHKFNVAGHEGYLTVGLYEDGTPGELFITMAKEGSTIGGLMDSLGTAISVALQYGVPTESLVTKFSHQRFEPAGMSRNPEIPFAKSLVDYIFRWMGMEFVPGYREANAPRREQGEIALERPKVEPRAEAASAGAAMAPEHGSDPHTGHGNGHATRRFRFDPEVATERPGVEMRAQLAGGPALNKAAAESGSGIDTALAASMKEMQADAPACDVCGTITVRNGTCYRCMNCGASMGCS